MQDVNKEEEETGFVMKTIDPNHRLSAMRKSVSRRHQIHSTKADIDIVSYCTEEFKIIRDLDDISDS